MTLNKPTRDEFRNAYRAVAGFDLIDNTIDAFFRMAACIREGKFNTFLAVIEWDDSGRVDIRNRSFG